MALNRDEMVITLDVDWASDEIIQFVAEILMLHEVKATWFATHQSRIISEVLSKSDLFEVGIHPNCLFGSTHGSNEDDVLLHMRNLFPDAKSMRTHGLYQSSVFLQKSCLDYGVHTDSSILLHGASDLAPTFLRFQDTPFVRIPFFWEDDVEMTFERPCWDFFNKKYQVSGLKVFSFHPVHVALNCSSLIEYERLKKIRPVSSWEKSFLMKNQFCGEGTRTLFESVVAEMSGSGRTISEISADALEV